MPDIRVSIVTRSEELLLGPDPVKLRPGPIVLSVAGHSGRRIRVDGVERRLSGGSTGLLALDYTRSTGYHRVDVEDRTVWFATEDGKLGLDGIRQMLDHLKTVGTGWSGQVLFSNSTGYRDPHVLYGWFDAYADQALDAVETVLMAPRTAEVSVRALSRRGGSSVLTVPTVRFLRSDAKRNVIEHPQGVLVAGDARYNPTRVVARRRQQTIDTVPNRRAVHLLALVEQLLSELMLAPLDTAPHARCRIWRERVSRLSSQGLTSQLRFRPNALAESRQGVEYTDRSYRSVFDVAASLVGTFGWSAQVDPSRRYSYIESADRIYQAYTAHRVASVLGLSPTSDVLGTSDLAFTGADYDLYYDCLAPAHVAPSWRASSGVPDASRPDLLLHAKATGQVAVLDAKYRVGADGNASEDSRKDVAAYQSLYGLNAVTILFPGMQASARAVEGHGMSIIEIPVYGPLDALAQDISRVLNRLQDPPYK